MGPNVAHRAPPPCSARPRNVIPVCVAILVGRLTKIATQTKMGGPGADTVVILASETVSTEIEEAPHVRPWWAPMALVAFGALVICTNIANAVWARWVNVNPEGLLILSSRNRYLALTLAAGVPLGFYVVIAYVRISVAFYVCHLIGRGYQSDAVGWFRKYLGVTPEAIDTFNRGFEKAQWAVIPIFAGSNIVAALSGVHRTPVGKLFVLVSIGIAGRLVAMWWLARTFEDQLVSFLEFLARYQWWAVGISIAVVLLVNLRNFRSA